MPPKAPAGLARRLRSRPDGPMHISLRATMRGSEKSRFAMILGESCLGGIHPSLTTLAPGVTPVRRLITVSMLALVVPAVVVAVPVVSAPQPSPHPVAATIHHLSISPMLALVTRNPEPATDTRRSAVDVQLQGSWAELAQLAPPCHHAGADRGSFGWSVERLAGTGLERSRNRQQLRRSQRSDCCHDARRHRSVVGRSRRWRWRSGCSLSRAPSLWICGSI